MKYQNCLGSDFPQHPVKNIETATFANAPENSKVATQMMLVENNSLFDNLIEKWVI